MKVTTGMRWNRLLAGLAAAIVLLLVLAWVRGGPETMRTITEPVALPEAAR